jgi:hypothetical protein
MNMREIFPNPKQETSIHIDVTDYDGESFYPLLKLLPAEIAKTVSSRLNQMTWTIWR